MAELRFDYVYNPNLGNSDINTYKNLHITLDVVKDEKNDKTFYLYELTIACDEDIDDGDIVNIVKELEDGRFKKMDINIAKDCNVLLSVSGTKRKLDTDFLRNRG